ncbi:DUF937 domain-containing protein [Methylocella sp. CPCC 101449]|jgi:hypothetical protein|uniref:DUF937 domain-containing protein n=1 Tax=Methylocella sp. CPCC 101449 TaxID=2987531 RepID=UPI0028915E6F|nr:DUF937 domain-containing protein [Methylocella sp. CPCC 101449]MDT2024003.1 DUF937 domain-containing protein [Methylocella sp. CPCC 101449]HEV2570674.1 DUF937 domain-containing protein [Beijerinckiaceae bacterium]
MFNLYEIVQASQGGDGVKTLARMYGLSDQQAEAAVGAILPAMSQRLQAKAQDPQGMAELFSAMMNGQGMAAFSNPAAAQSGDARQFGRDMLGQMFGDRDASRQLAAHAAQAADVSQDIMQKLMPAIIAIVMGGLTKSMNDKGLGGILEQIGGAFGQPGPQTAPQSGSGLPGNGLPGGLPGGMPGNGLPGGAGGGLGDILGQILQGTFGQPPQAGAPGGGDILDQAGRTPQAGGATPQTPSPNATPGATPGSSPMAFPGGFDPKSIQAGIDMLGKILGHGTQQAPQQQANLNDILGQLFGNKR